MPDLLDEALNGTDRPRGIGLAMEGTRNNPVFFELVADHLWSRVTDLDAWLHEFVRHRYGRDPEGDLVPAWQGLVQTVYDARGVRIFPEQFNGILTAKPSYEGIPDRLADIRTDVDGALWYDPATLVNAWDRMVSVAERDRTLAAGPLGHDLLETATAVMARVADRLYLDAIERSVRRRQADRPAIERFLRLFDDLDRLLATRAEFTFQRWESQAVAWSTNPEDHAVLTDNARRILTVWGETTNPRLDDYAGRIWAGLVGGYYKDRWGLWADGLDVALTSPGRHDGELEAALQERAARFLREGCPPSREPPGDLVNESRRLIDRYGDLVRTRVRRPDGA